jgi:hypothetical protein
MSNKINMFKNPEEKIKEIIKNQYYNDISFNDLKFKHFLKSQKEKQRLNNQKQFFSVSKIENFI